MSLTTSTAVVRVNIRDNSATAANQAFADADITNKLNDAYRLVSRKYFPRIARQTAAQTGLTITGSGSYIGTTSATNYARIIAICRATAFSLAHGTWIPVQEMMDKWGAQAFDGTVIPGSPLSHWTAWREGTDTTASQGKWTVAVFPAPASSSTYSMLVEMERTDLSAGSDTMDIPPEGISMVENLASYWLASILERNYAGIFISQWPELKELATEKRVIADTLEGRGAGQ